MNLHRLVTGLVMLGFLAGDGLALAGGSACEPAAEGARLRADCCCGPETCPAEQPGASGLRAACCDLGAPDRSAEGPTVPREAPPAPPTHSVSPPVVSADAVPALPHLEATGPGFPASFHAPPRFAQFRSYRL